MVNEKALGGYIPAMRPCLEKLATNKEKIIITDIHNISGASSLAK
jgi:hypothetical protein